ncbi:hypothetical protein [Bacillus wiedmannii]|uniref:hypothetical protein n=1 Tax=Bacillus wiedmannii TaxID=1890302 RepID=UPI000B44555A|nr:hypothetical protein [Bacillus wiedmannii]OUB90935.1 hypothetical protein BK788_00500 [Bacillus thuringiensis serovar sinensis]
MGWKDWLEIIKVILPALTGIGGVWLGSRFAFENNIKVQKKFTLQKLRIDKTQEVSASYLEYTKELSVLLMNVNRYRLNKLSNKDFQLEFIATQERVNEFGRSIQVNKVFCSNIKSDVDVMQALYVDIIEGINNTLINIEILSDNEKEHILKGLTMDITSLQMSLHVVLEDINKILKKEIEELEDL